MKPIHRYFLFGWEACECRPNCDPFKGDIRTYPMKPGEISEQVYTTSEHLKHHVRRGLRAAAEPIVGQGKAQVFYDKSGTFDGRMTDIRKEFKIETSNPYDAYRHCVDLPLFGYVHAKEKESYNAVNAVNCLFRPVTPHACTLLPLSTNNAFVGTKDIGTTNTNGPEEEEEEEEANSAAGSHTTLILEYGFFLALLELNIPTLTENTKNHQLIKDPQKWMELFANGLWLAYTEKRLTSLTQRNQVANFLLGWEPTEDHIDLPVLNPRYLFRPDVPPKIEDPFTARVELAKVLSAYLAKLGYSPKNERVHKGQKYW